jgi:formylglycine-generating enzyme required for sulfatase activity
MTSIFVSYRREDSRHQAGRIYEHLVAHFGSGQVFKDDASIPLGLDFREVLTERVAGCDVFLAVIGDTWLSSAGKSGTRRLDNPGDFVRIEIEAALSRRIPVIPVLVGNSPVPPAEELPESLRGLSFRNGLPVRPDPDFHHDMDRLIHGIEDGVKALRERSTRRGRKTQGTEARTSAVGAGAVGPPKSRLRRVGLAGLAVALAFLAVVIVTPRLGPFRDRTPPESPHQPQPTVPDEPPKTITNSIGLQLALIPAGEFLMGSSKDEDKDAEDDETPRHRVRITRPFYLGVTEVTVGQFRRVVESSGYRTEAERDGRGNFGWNEQAGKFEGRDPKYTWKFSGFGQTDEHPVVNVTWNDAIAFCNMLSELERLKPYYRLGAGERSGGDGYRLPTEAEWEYACRARTTTRYQSGDDPETLAAVGNVADGTARAKYPDWTWSIASRDGYVYTAPVGRFRANAFGLFDMHGNVWEWCWDGYESDYYKRSPVDDPQVPSGASAGVIRGGGWNDSPLYARSANRSRVTPDNRNYFLGFRLARGQSGSIGPAAVKSPDLQKPQPTVPVEPPKSITSSIGMQLALIPAGEFLMGSSKDQDKDAGDDETPRHPVRITRPFYLGLTEVTQGQYRAVTGESPSQFRGSDDLPVEHVSWLDAVRFCNGLSELERLPPFYRIKGDQVAVADPRGVGYRLPTEAEWEYACRARNPARYSFGHDPAVLGEYAWFYKNSGSKTHPVGQNRPNGFGLFDMHGNVWEWCWDEYRSDYYKGSPVDDPQGQSGASVRVIRGGSWSHDPQDARSANRFGNTPDSRSYYLGFRLARGQSGSR